MEQFIKEATQEFMQAIDYSFVDALGDLIAKAYNKGFEACKKAYHIDDAKFLKEQEEIFPELAKSEDEKVRKALIDFFGKGAKYGGQTNGVYDKDILAWLEKQKGNICGISPNSAWSEEDEQHVNSLLKRLEGMCKKGATYTATRFAVSQDIDWLKSLKERKGGKI